MFVNGKPTEETLNAYKSMNNKGWNETNSNPVTDANSTIEKTNEVGCGVLGLACFGVVAGTCMMLAGIVLLATVPLVGAPLIVVGLGLVILGGIKLYREAFKAFNDNVKESNENQVDPSYSGGVVVDDPTNLPPPPPYGSFYTSDPIILETRYTHAHHAESKSWGAQGRV